MSDPPSRTQSRWIRFVALFLLWVGGRAIFNIVLFQTDPDFRAAQSAVFGPAFVVWELVSGVLGIGAGVAIYLRLRHALMMATAALALYTGLGAMEIQHTASNLPAARAAYKVNREARGVPVADERLDAMFSPATIPVLWVAWAAFCVPPYLILLWKKHELEPVAEEDD
jgi:hypothetical protein